MHFARSCSKVSSFLLDMCGKSDTVTVFLSKLFLYCLHTFHCAHFCQLAALLEAYNVVRSMLASSPRPLVAATVGQSPASNDCSGTRLDCHNRSLDGRITKNQHGHGRAYSYMRWYRIRYTKHMQPRSR